VVDSMPRAMLVAVQGPILCRLRVDQILSGTGLAFMVLQLLGSTVPLWNITRSTSL
jgi:hypothetical protein